MPCIRSCLANFEVMFLVGKCKHDFYISLHFLVIQYIPDLIVRLKVLFCSPLLRCCLHLWHLCMCFLRSSLLILRHFFCWRRLLCQLIYNIKVKNLEMNTSNLEVEEIFSPWGSRASRWSSEQMSSPECAVRASEQALATRDVNAVSKSSQFYCCFLFR